MCYYAETYSCYCGHLAALHRLPQDGPTRCMARIRASRRGTPVSNCDPVFVSYKMDTRYKTSISDNKDDNTKHEPHDPEFPRKRACAFPSCRENTQIPVLYYDPWRDYEIPTVKSLLASTRYQLCTGYTQEQKEQRAEIETKWVNRYCHFRLQLWKTRILVAANSRNGVFHENEGKMVGLETELYRLAWSCLIMGGREMGELECKIPVYWAAPELDVRP